MNCGIALFGISGLILRFVQKSKNKIFNNSNSELFVRGNLTSGWQNLWSEVHPNGERCEIKVVNNLENCPLYFCWIGPDGILHHFRRINDRSIKDGSVSNSLVEYATTFHSFVCFTSTQQKEINRLHDLDENLILFLFKPRYGKQYLINVDESIISLNGSQLQENLPMQQFTEYKLITLEGFSVYLDVSLQESRFDFIDILREDLSQINHLLPDLPLKLLQQYTPLYVNASLVYGTVGNIVHGRHMCYHSFRGSNWLIAHGLSPQKAGSVEINRIEDYLSSRGLWGKGGLLLHEFCHAFHDKHTVGGYSCLEIQQAYEQAMEKKLYESVKVHGEQGKHGPIKAYACTNCMEFWAELSVAYHCNVLEEYNKWFPHNSSQLKSHDPHSFSVLDKIWKDLKFPRNFEVDES